MSDYRISSESRIFPGGMENELQRLPWRAVGVLLAAIAVIGWVSLASWSIGDPSLNRATNGSASNLLGTVGASIADMLLQMFGLASIALFLPIAVWGVTIASGDRFWRPRRSLLLWAASMVLIASTLSILPQPKGWLLTHGLGGVVGDFGRSFFLRIGSFLNPNFAGIIGAVTAGYLGLWALVAACGMAFSDLRLLWALPARGSRSRTAVISGVTYLYDRGINLKDRVTRAIERESQKRHYRADDWDEPVPAPRRTFRRSTEASFDPRFNGHEGEPHAVAASPARRPITRAAPGVEEPVARRPGAAASRVEPFFEQPGFPAPEPGHRMVRMLPVHVQQPRPALPPEGYRPAEPYAPRVPHPAPLPPHAPYGHPHPGDTGHSDQPHRPAPQPPEHGYDNGYRAAPYDVREEQARLRQAYAQQSRPPYEPDEDDGMEYDARDYQPEPPRPTRPAPPPPQQRAPLSRGGGSSRALIASSTREDDRFADFTLPSVRLLTSAPERRGNPELSDSALGRKAELLHGVLEDFGVKGTITGVHPGPVITLFELEPARGTKSSRVIGLSDDIARSMSAVSARVAVIPGRDAIGIELPNNNRETVYLRELLEASDFAKGKAALPLALGKTIAGAPVVVDLARMPHLLIAGTTGSGKSVAINAMILSLLYRLTPEQCRFIMIDPKMLELSVYDDIPHLLTPVVTDPRKAIAALKWTVGEMNVRYERMCKLGVRNITGFNQKVSRAKVQGRPLTRTVQTGFDEETGEAIYEREDIDDTPMPYIVVVIDEMADLMMVAGKDIEYAVQRLSQMARAAGIHLIMATQRPSVDVITGTIKANFPSRVSFQVTSKIDSRTILGEQGAEQLLGAGDMLSMAAGGRIMRAHGPFVSDEEVERVVSFLKEQAEPEYLDGLLDDIEPVETGKRGRGGGGEADNGREPSGEDVYDQAVEIVLKERRATTSYLQRRLGIGYNRAASLIERMEQDGLISPPNRTGKREVLSGDAD
jgi:S-DNA-T family DNA segregation ATPase FtsK/SpoIIIE